MALFSKDGPKPLDTAERSALLRCEAAISKHLEGYQAVGNALREIRDRQLYRTTHPTFDEYVKHRWKMEATHAYRLIAAADVARNLSPTGDTPATERAARELTGLPIETQRQAWTEAKALAGEREPTAAIVATAAAKHRRSKKAKTRTPKAIRFRVPGAIVVVHPNRAFTSAADALAHAIAKANDSTAKKAA